MFLISVSQGFTELIPIDLIKIFDENELEVTTSHIPITQCLPLSWRLASKASVE